MKRTLSVFLLLFCTSISAAPPQISGSPVTGQVTFWDSSDTVTGDHYFLWNSDEAALYIDPLNYGGVTQTLVLSGPGGYSNFLGIVDEGSIGNDFSGTVTVGYQSSGIATLALQGGEAQWLIDNGGGGLNLYPLVANGQDIGLPAYPVRSIYTGTIVLSNVPTSDPHVAGALWQDPITHVLMVSQGP